MKKKPNKNTTQVEDNKRETVVTSPAEKRARKRQQISGRVSKTIDQVAEDLARTKWVEALANKTSAAARRKAINKKARVEINRDMEEMIAALKETTDAIADDHMKSVSLRTRADVRANACEMCYVTYNSAADHDGGTAYGKMLNTWICCDVCGDVWIHYRCAPGVDPNTKVKPRDFPFTCRYCET